jgi:lauroyl/myristoyl acyltransferase
VLVDVLQPRDFAGASPEEIATRINASLERLILARPEQYFWLHDRYRGADELTRAREEGATAKTAETAEADD